MVEVIDLLSSSPPRPSEDTAVTTQKQTTCAKDIFSFGSDDDVISGFPIEQPLKKQKLTAITRPAQATISQTSKSTQALCFDFSSDDDFIPELKTLSKPITGSVSKALSPFSFDDDIDIHLSSSAPEPIRQTSPESHAVLGVRPDSGFINDPIQTSSPSADTAYPTFSQRTTKLLVSARAGAPKSTLGSRGRNSASRFKRATSVDQHQLDYSRTISKSKLDTILDCSQQDSISKGSQKLEQTAIQAKQNEPPASATSKASKQAEKEAERERKRQEKEVRAQAKQRATEIAEANKCKTNKKNSTSEMILDLPTSLQGTSLASQLEDYAKELSVELNYVNGIDGETTVSNKKPTKQFIRWRRKVTAGYDEDQELWYPLPEPRLSVEEHIMVYVKAEDFVRMAATGDANSINSPTDMTEETMKSNLDKHIADVRKLYPKCRIVYLIEGLNAWLKKSFNAKNRAYTAAARAQHTDANADADIDNSEGDEDGTIPEKSSSTKQRRKPSTNRRKAPTSASQPPTIDLSSITESTTEALLIHLQIHHQPLVVHHTTSPKTSASQISIFTQQLSTRPYRLAAQNANLTSASFCMTTGQIRTGSTSDETWIQMLQEINRVTPSMAYGVVATGYTNPMKLIKGFRTEGRLMLEDVRKSVNRDGAWSDRRLGPMVSKRVYKVFMGKDPGARDGMA